MAERRKTRRERENAEFPPTSRTKAPRKTAKMPTPTPKLFLEIFIDTDAENPSDMDGSWTFHSFRSRDADTTDPLDFFAETPKGMKPKGTLSRKLNAGLAFLLDCYEHGDRAWSLASEGMNCEWDTSGGAGLLIWTHKAGDMGAKTPKDRATDARNFLSAYNDWINGACYGYTLTDEQGGDVDSCSGFIGSDGIFESINEVVPEGVKVVVSGDSGWLVEYNTIKNAASVVQEEDYDEDEESEGD